MKPEDEKFAEEVLAEWQAISEAGTPELRVQRALRVVHRLFLEFEGVLKRLIEELPAPESAELEEMAAGRRPFPLAALLTSELWQAFLLIEQAGTSLEIASRYGLREGQRRRKQGWGTDSPEKAAAQIRAALAEVQAWAVTPGVQ